MRHVSDDERRARLAVRHALDPAAKVATPEAAARAVAVLHATEPATVYLSCWARVPSLTVSDVDRALFRDRTVVKQLGMRRTLFALPRDLLPAVLSSASARVAATERARMVKDLHAAGITDDGGAWLDRAREGLLTALAAAPGGLSAAEVRRAVPVVDITVPGPSGEVWSVPRLLTHLGLTGHVVRGTTTGCWWTSRPQWTLMSSWLGQAVVPLDGVSGHLELVARWLRAFGPGTEDDLVWWLGATKAVVRAALAGLGAAAVTLDGGGVGWLLPDDVDEVADPGPWVALLPVLDPTMMGWRGRDFYLGPHRGALFDRWGNAGTTAWVDGRVVGCWIQDGDATVRVRLLEPVPDHARTALDAEATRLTTWLAGRRIGTGYTSPTMRSS